jgi:hypothetical protein
MSTGLSVFGSSRSARRALTFTSSGWLSVVPRKFAPEVPLFPMRDQASREPDGP